MRNGFLKKKSNTRKGNTVAGDYCKLCVGCVNVVLIDPLDIASVQLACAHVP
jgi:hypothetical protein